MVINDKSQSDVPPCLRRRESFDYYFIKNLPLSFLSKNFNNRSTFAKVIGKKVDCSTRHLQYCTVRLKDKLARDPTCDGQGTVVTASH